SGIDRPKTLSEHHPCRHGLPGLAERRQSDTLLSPEVRKGCSLYNCRHGSPPMRLVAAPSWRATSECSHPSSVVCFLNWKRFLPPDGQSNPILYEDSIRGCRHIAVTKGDFPITKKSQYAGGIDSAIDADADQRSLRVADATHRSTTFSPR